MTERHEYSEQLWITDGVSGGEQEGSFMNATLQGSEGVSFSIAVHVGLPASVRTEAQVHRFLKDVFLDAIEHTDKLYGQSTLNVEIQIGPTDDGEG